MSNSNTKTVTNNDYNINSELFNDNIDNHIHGGQLNKSAQKYNIPLGNWVDLSTGINQNGYPIPKIPEAVWNRLPENNDELTNIAAHYYQCDSLLAVAGSQVAIQSIPMLFSKSTVGIIQPGYYEHEKNWLQHCHSIVNFQHYSNNESGEELELITQINKKISGLNVLIIINPNNPSGMQFSKQQLFDWHKILLKRNAYLIVDEAFMDANDSNSLLSSTLLPNLIVLRSIGKFFGLAGIRLGFIFANQSILNKIAAIQGPWPISGPSRWIASKALADIQWQNKTRSFLHENSQRLKKLLLSHNLVPSGGTELFQWVITPQAAKIYHILNQQGVLTRLFNNPKSLRFGLPKDDLQWKRLESALLTCTNNLTHSI